ncbi:SURF1 family protein [Ramlibacter sp. 2FC]|uniref:SURF1 family protein n=1 Tax=Ramlibacter sp. 2FC TaxID=2502188 RepID=UPI0010F94CD9|nr:SURF1 family protein [Ramlibacter sp. 2FC]
MSPPRADWRFGLITLATLAGMVTTASLGRWQLSRASEKEALQAGIEARQQLAVLGAAELLATPEADRMHRRVQLRGRWLAERTVFLDNRQMNGQPGFYVLTPLQLQEGGAWLLVQRGWVPRNFVDRNALPRVDTPAGEVALQGRIAPAPSKLYAFEGAEQGVIRQNLALDAFRAETRLPLLDQTVVQTGPPSEGLLRQWPEPASGVEKHYGYAFQWFGLSGLMAILYVWFQIVRRFLFPPRA